MIWTVDLKEKVRICCILEPYEWVQKLINIQTPPTTKGIKYQHRAFVNWNAWKKVVPEKRIMKMTPAAMDGIYP
jgi:hypothetical protein